MFGPTDVYTRTAVALHWLVALLILAALPLGLYMTGLKLSPLKLQLYSYHKWLGVTIFGLAILRVLWRLRHPAPPLPMSVPVWQQQAAGALHRLLYVLMLVLPVSGWLMSSAKGVQTVYLGLLPLPDLLSKDDALGELLGVVHVALAYTLAALACMHIGAALKHQFVDRDGVLARMLPFLRR